MHPALSLAILEEFDPHAPDHGTELRFNCPLCGYEKKKDAAHRSLAVHKDTGKWCCHRCGAKGVVQEHWEEKPWVNRCDRGRAQLRRAFGGVEKVDTVDVSTSPDPQLREQLRDLVKLTGTPGETYLLGRGIPRALAAAARVRYTANWFGRPAAVFPVYDQAGQLVAAQGRHLDDRPPKVRSAGEIRRGVFGTPQAWEQEALILVEAPIDALTLHAAGYPAIALCGASNCPPWLPQALAFRRVLLALDGDEAGDAAALKLAARLRPLGARVERLRPNWFGDWNALEPRLLDGLAAALDGVLRPERAPTPPARTTPAPAWDDDRAFALLSAAVADLGEQIPAGTLELAEVYYPELLAALDQAEAALNAAYEAADPEAFAAALAGFGNATGHLVDAVARAASGG
jgi:hypothetical protein